MKVPFNFFAYNICCRIDSDKLHTGIVTKIKQKWFSVVPSKKIWCCLASNYLPLSYSMIQSDLKRKVDMITRHLSLCILCLLFSCLLLSLLNFRVEDEACRVYGKVHVNRITELKFKNPTAQHPEQVSRVCIMFQLTEEIASHCIKIQGGHLFCRPTPVF